METHKKHVLLPISELQRRARVSQRMAVDAQAAYKSTVRMLDRLTELVTKLRQEHEMMFSVQSTAILKHKEPLQGLIEGRVGYPFTGRMLHEMLADAETQPAIFPYMLTHDEIFKSLTPDILTSVEAQVRKAWRQETSEQN